MNSLKTRHNLDFEVAPWPTDPSYQKFRIGTVGGLWSQDKDSYIILAFDNKQKGNGHLEDVFEWFEHSCERDNKDLLIQEVWNKDFKQHLLNKRGFVRSGKDDVIKRIKRKLRK